MYVNGIRCDTCDKIHNMNVVKDHLPLNWLAVEQREGDRMHFCSLECLRLWIPKNPVVSEWIAGEDDEPKITLSDRFC